MTEGHTANDEYYMLARDTASVLWVVCVGLGRYVYFLSDTKLVQLQIAACKMPEEELISLLIEIVK